MPQRAITIPQSLKVLKLLWTTLSLDQNHPISSYSSLPQAAFTEILSLHEFMDCPPPYTVTTVVEDALPESEQNEAQLVLSDNESTDSVPSTHSTLPKSTQEKLNQAVSDDDLVKGFPSHVDGVVAH